MAATLGVNDVDRAVSAALQKATDLGVPCSVAIVDGGRELLAFRRQDGAPLASIEISIGKAYTARSLNSDTKDLGSLAQPGGPLYGLETTHQRSLVTFGGGRPLSADGAIVGAVGAAGGTPDQDHEIASAAVDALG